MRVGLSVAFLLGWSGTVVAAPKGIYSSGGPTTIVNNSVDSRLHGLPYVDGALVRIAWKDIETSPGVYDWSRLDAQFDRADQFGLKISLGIVNGFNSPTWLSTQGAQSFSYSFRGTPVSMPVPWDPVFLDRWTQFVDQLGARYQSSPALELVHITTSTANGFEMQLPFSPVDVANWTAAGYTLERHVGAYRQVIDAFDQAFPNTHLDLEVHPVLGSDLVAQQAVAYGNSVIGSRFGVFAAWWSQHNADVAYPGMYQLLQEQAQQTYSTVQLVTNATNFNSTFGSGGIDEAINRARSIGIEYFEPWDVDLLNTGLAGFFDDMHYGLFPVPGDSDADRDVDFDDLLVLAQHYGESSNVDWQKGDFNDDGVINFDDLLLLAQYYDAPTLGESLISTGVANGFAADWSSAQSLLPEPGVALLALCMPSSLARRRCRCRRPSARLTNNKGSLLFK